MKQAIVSGSTGFIGSYFVEYLIKKNIDVISLGRKEVHELSPRRRKILKGSNYVSINMRKISKLKDEIKKQKISIGNACVFFNLAWGGLEKLSDLNVESQLDNVSDSLAAMEVSKKLGCTKFIQIGTMEEAFTEKYLDLDYKINKEYNRHVIYSVAKIAAKKALFLKSSSLGIDFNYVLHSHVMGADDDKDSFLQVTLEKLINGDDLIFSSGEQYFDVISPKDCAIGYYLIGEKGKNGETYWVGSGNPRKLKEYLKIMYEQYPSGKEMRFGELPYNDIVLSPEDFSIQNLVRDTKYSPTLSFEKIVEDLYKYLINKKK